MGIEEKNKISAFFAKEYGKLVNFVKGRISGMAEADAEDIVQDVALRLFEAPDITRPVERLAAYIYQALRNKIADIFRKRHPELSLDSAYPPGQGFSLKEIIPDDRYGAESLAEKKELLSRLYQAIDSLNPEERAVLLATEFDGCSFSELALEWGIPLGTLLARKSRAVKKIRDAFIKDKIDLKEV